MADWLKPTITSDYINFVAEVDGRLNDAAQMFVTDPVSPPVGSMRYHRATNLLQEWDGAAWQNKVISIAGGGTGASTPAGILGNLNLGTMAQQNSNAVVITGGVISGITSLSMSGPIVFAADGTLNIGTNANRPGTVYIRNGIVIPVGVDKFVTA